MSLSSQEIGIYVTAIAGDLKDHHLSSPILYCHDTFFFHLSGMPFHRFVISLNDENPRFYVAEETIEVPSMSSRFLDTIKHELSNAYLNEIEQANDDRIVKMTLTTINSVFKEEGRFLYFEMIPHHANLIITNLDNVILGSFRPGEMSDTRPLLKGLHYQFLDKKKFSISAKARPPFDTDAYLEKCLSLEITLAETRKKNRFGFLLSSLKRRQNLLERKSKSIASDIKNAETHLNDGAFGDAIFINMSSLSPHLNSFDYEGKSISLDPARSLSQNAELFYKRAKKAKETISIGKTNLEKTEEELKDTKSALSQISVANEAGLEALAKELGISEQVPTKKRKEKSWHGLSRSSLPYYLDFHGTKILFGHNAKQNDCLTFLFDTAKNHLWFHVIGNTGSHVMIKKDDPSGEDIEAAAEVAIAASGLEEGEVMITKRSEVRKGQVMGQAIVKHFETRRINAVHNEIKDLIKNATKADF